MLKKKSIASTPCQLCQSSTPFSAGVCAPCWQDLPLLGHACQACAMPLSDDSLTCGQCQQSPPLFDRTLALFVYAPPVDHLIKGVKFGDQLHLLPQFAAMLADKVAEHPLPECILPVPLHPTRLRQRGFNQALAIAQPVAKTLGVPLDFHSLRRVRDTPQQTRLDALERQNNLKDAFDLRQPFDAKHVALVDDIMTTGNTVHEISKLLRKNGVEQIDVWLIARAIV
ncbi:MAG: ComF family protein [Gammaproteobacteria bacterium]|nr:ComF family protein [Gammaproteobacteria bacterium]